MILYDVLYPTIAAGWYRRLPAPMRTFAAYGGNLVLLPSPLRVGWDGPNVTGMRYNPISNLDIGQYFDDELQPGTAKDAQAMARAFAKVGMRIILDRPGQFGSYPVIERNGDGVQDKNLAYIPHAMFDAKRDGTFEQGQAFGLRIPLEYSEPRGYLIELVKQCMTWLLGVFGGVGFRFDKAKDIWPIAQREFNTLGQWNVGEYYDGNNANVDNFVRTTGLAAFDFGSHFAYRAVSQGAGLDALIYNDRYCMMNPGRAVIFVDNHDTDGATGVVNSKGWAYFDAATTPALAWCVYAKDYELYGLAPIIHNCMWIHTKLAAGKRVNTIVSADVLVWFRDGAGGDVQAGPGVVCGISRDPFNTRWMWTDTPFHSCWLKNYALSGGPNVWVHDDGRACIPLPPNRYGRADNYVAYAPLGHDGPIETKEVFLQLTNPLDFSKITVRLAQ